MSFDGIFLHHLMKELTTIKTGRISKIAEASDTDFIFTIRKDRANMNLVLSFSSDFARIHFSNKQYDSPKTPKSFTMLLRKYIEGYFIEDIYQYENDRVVTFKLNGYSEMRDFSTKYLICEIMGRYSNLILTDENYKIIDVLKKDGVGEFNRTMLPNATYEYPISDKLNPFTKTTTKQITSPKDLLNQYNGVSMLLAEYCFKDDNILGNLNDIISTCVKPCIIKTTKGKKDFYFHPLNNEIIQEYNTISELLDNYYYEADLAFKIKHKTNDLQTFIQRQITKNEKKIIKLKAEIASAMHADEFKILGELLLSYPNLKDKSSSVSVFNYYTNETIKITLDPKYDIITNSQKYYKKYQKAKSAIHYINEQMDKANDEIQYFKILLNQLATCSLNDAIEIKEELIENKYILAKDNKTQKKKKPTILTYVVDNTLISVGKNNIQNEYITHKLSKSNDYWFHIKDFPGSHVVVHSDYLTEELIRTAANLAALYSTFKDSSSVAVDYTQIKNIKKIPGKKNCFVTYTKQKTIYIDPDNNLLNELKVKK